MLGVKSAVVMCGKQMSVSTYNLACSCYSTVQCLVVLIISPMDTSRIVWSRIQNLSKQNCLCNIVEFKMIMSELIHTKLPEIILHYLNFA